MNLFLKGNFYLVIIIGKFSSQLYITIQPKRAISSQYFFQRLNFSRVILCINTCRIKNFCYTSRRVVRANSSHKVHAIL